MSVGPVTWVILSEIFPTRIRGRAMAMATICLWLANYVVSQTFPMMDDDPWLVARFHHGFPFWLYAAFCLVLLVVVVRFVPETKGKTLEEIERLDAPPITEKSHRKTTNTASVATSITAHQKTRFPTAPGCSERASGPSRNSTPCPGRRARGAWGIRSVPAPSDKSAGRGVDGRPRQRPRTTPAAPAASSGPPRASRPPPRRRRA